MTREPGSPRLRLSVRLLWVGAGLLLAAALGVVVFLATLDSAIYKRALERELSSVLGRAVSVGSLSISLSMPPALAASDLRIANPPWASRPDFLTAASGEVAIDLLALWHDRIVLRGLHLRGVDLLLERDADGADNWSFGAGDRAGKPARLPDFDAVSLTDARIAWQYGTPGAVQVDRAQATIRADAPFELHAQVAYREAPMRFELKSDASLQAALGGQPWRLVVELAPPGAALRLEVQRASFASLQDAELAFELTGERLDAWSGVAGRSLPKWGPYRLSGTARYAADSVQVDGLRLSLAGLPTPASQLEIDSGTATLGANVDTRLTAAGSFGATPFSFAASSLPLAQLPKSGFPITLRAALADLALSAQGQLSAADFELALTVRGDARALAQLAGLPARRPLPVDLSTRLSRSAEGYAATNIAGRVLGCTLAGDLAFSASQDSPVSPRPLISGALQLGRLDWPALQALQSGDGAAAPASGKAGAAAWFAGVDGDLSLRIAEIAGLPVTARSLSGRLQLHGGVIGVQEFAAQLANSEVSASGSLRWIDQRPRIEAKARIALLDLRKLDSAQRRLDDPLPPAPAMDGTLQLEIARIAGAPLALAKLGKLRLQAELQRGKLAIDELSATLAEVPVQGHALLEASGKEWRITANAKARHLDLAALLRSLQQPQTASGAIDDLQLELATQGASLRALLAKARLSVRSAPFVLKVGRDRTPVSVQRASVEAEPGRALQLSAQGEAFGRAMQLTVVAGALAELLDSKQPWPKIEATLRTQLGAEQGAGQAGEALEVTARSGPLRRSMPLGDAPLLLQARLPGAQASVEGTMKQLAAGAATPLSGRLEIADLGRTAALFSTARLPAIPLTASGRVVLGDGELSIDSLALQAGGSDASGRLRIRWRDRPALFVDIGSRQIDLAQWVPGAEHAQHPESEVALLDRPIAARALLAQDVQLRLRAQRLILPNYDLARVALDGTLKNGVFEFSAAAAEGDLRGELRFDVRRAVPGLALRLSLQEVEPASLYTAADGPSSDAPRLSIRAQLAGSGSTLRAMLASGQGEFLLTAGPGALPIGAAHGLERVAGNLLLVLVPGRRSDDYARIECAAARFKIADGVATSSDGVALRTKQVDILGSGAVQLPTGQILFGYRAVRRELFSFSMLGLSSGLAKVAGTIGNPSIELDPGGLVLRASTAWATAGLSLLAGDLWRKLESTSDPCARIAAGASTARDPLDLLIGSLPAVKRLSAAPP